MFHRPASVSIAALLSAAGLARAQFTQTWDMYPAPGWTVQNNSFPLGVATYGAGDPGFFPAFAGEGYLSVGYESGSELATISNWMISPVVPLTNGAEFKFYTRTVDDPGFPDRLQVRMNKVNTGTNVGTGASDVGDFTELLLDINPNYELTGYPSVWTEYAITITGITGTVNGRLAFRYFAEDGGPAGTTSDYIGIDESVYNATAQPTGHCCLPSGACEIRTEAQCINLSGTNWQSGTDCASISCPQPPTGACCTLSSCQVITAAACTAQNGVYQGNNTACATCPTVYTYEGGSISIPDGLGTVDCGEPALAEIVVNESFVVTSADAAFFITHTWQGDVTIRLAKVGGPSVTLVERPGVPPAIYGFATENYGASSADEDLFRSIDTAPNMYDLPATSGLDNPTGFWKPESPLSAFVGVNAQGTWRLEVTDCAGDFIGTVDAFKLSLGGGSGPACYANCDGSTATPALTANDFQCFINKYAGNEAYANCDGSTATPALTANDFQCFINKYAGGCS